MDTFAPSISLRDIKRISSLGFLRKIARPKQIILQSLLLITLAVAMSGCIVAAVAGGAAAAVGTAAYVKGDLEVILEEDLDVVYAASKKALEDLEISIVGTDKDLLSAVVHGRGAEDKKVTIKMERVEKGRLVKLSVRVGTFGDKDFSKIIYDRINKHLIR